MFPTSAVPAVGCRSHKMAAAVGAQGSDPAHKVGSGGLPSVCCDLLGWEGLQGCPLAPASSVRRSLPDRLCVR